MKLKQLSMVTLIVAFIMGSLYLLAAPVVPTPAVKKISKIVIDAGHGGKDPGCHGQYSYEKNIALDVSKKLGDMILKFMPNVKVLYTRDYDILAGGDDLSIKQSLRYRHQMANSAKADLLISVHINSSPKRVTTANGTETYVLGLSRTDQKEGAIGEFAGNYVSDEGLLDPRDPLNQILIAQYSQSFLTRSILLGKSIEDEFSKQGRKSKGVKQKSLEVLAGTAMPAVLVELGFLNNPSEEAMLNSEIGKNKCALAIFRGIEKYKSEVESVGKTN